MFAKVKLKLTATKLCDLSKSAKQIHQEMFQAAFKGLRDQGFDPQVEELILEECEMMDAVRRGE